MPNPERPIPWKCGECRERAVFPETLSSYRVELVHDGRTYEVELANLPVFKCQKCGETLLGNQEEDRISSALRAAAGLLEPAVIRARREALGLTQKALANLLKIAESTLSRWETGAQIQQRVMDRLLRAFFDLEPLRDYFQSLEASSTSTGAPAQGPPLQPLSVGLAAEYRGSTHPTGTSPRPAS